jgi:methionine-S-sulfoxide reductase
VKSVTAGYAGGKKENPTYRSLGNHTETVRVEFDPSVVSYRELLDTFWANHNAYSRPLSAQYKSIIFFHDETQRKLAEASKKKLGKRRGRRVNTEIKKAGPFWVAEDYHQKYYLRNADHLYMLLRQEFKTERDFFSSTAAARLNAWIAGVGSGEAVFDALKAMPLVEETLDEWRRLLGIPKEEEQKPKKVF